jgi:hypothetical protein
VFGGLLWQGGEWLVTGLDRALGALGSAIVLSVGTGLAGIAALLAAAMFGSPGRVLGSLLLAGSVIGLAFRTTRHSGEATAAAVTLSAVVIVVVLGCLYWWNVREESLYGNDSLELRLVGEAVLGVFLTTLPLRWLQRREHP